MSRFASVLMVLICALLIACGGGGGTTAATGTTSTTSTSTTTSTTSTTSSTGTTMTPVKLTVNWAERSRAINAPSAAKSLVVTVFGGLGPSADYIFKIDRNSGAPAYTQSYTSPSTVRRGTLLVEVAFYSEIAGAGSIVAAGAADVDFSQNAGDIGSISIDSIIKSVTIPSNQSVEVGQTKDLLVECRDIDLNIVAVSPGSANLSIDSGSGFLGLNGPSVVGISGGVGTVIARVNGLSSPATPVNVTGGGATGLGRLFFVSDGPIIKSMSGDGSDLRELVDGTGVFSAISSPVPNHNRTKLAFAGTKSGFDSTLFVCQADGSNLVDLFENSATKPDGPHLPRWSVAPEVANNSATGLDLLWFIAVVPGSGLGSFGINTTTGVVNQSSLVDQLAVGSWSAATRPLLGFSKSTETGWNSTIDGTVIDQEAVGLSQMAVSQSTNGTSFWLVAVDGSGNLRRYDCGINNDGSGSTSVSVNSSTVLTTSGGFSNPTISPDGSMIAAERGSFEAPEIVTMTSMGGNIRSIATGRQPFWR